MFKVIRLGRGGMWSSDVRVRALVLGGEYTLRISLGCLIRSTAPRKGSKMTIPHIQEHLHG